MTINHASLTDPEIHEPKGVSTATAGQVYAANGSGGGAWAKPFKYASVATSYSTGSPYAYSASTSDAVLNPTVTTLTSSQFTIQTSPNLRLRYDGTETAYVNLVVNVSYSHAAGGDRDLELVIYKNGAAQTRSRVIETTPNGHYSTLTLNFNLTMVTNDYLEVFAKGSAAYTANFAKVYISAEGHVV